MWNYGRVEVKRTITILLPPDAALRATLTAFRGVQNTVSSACFNDGKPLHAVALQRAAYAQAKGVLSSQMTITAMRLVAGSYASALKGHKRRVALESARQEKCQKRGWKYRPKQITAPAVCSFQREMAMFLVGERGRDASIRSDGSLSIWTIQGRKRMPFRVVPGHQAMFDEAKEVDSITVIERDGKLYGRMALTLEVPDPKGASPVGIDLNETNAIVAVDVDGRELFISGLQTKINNKRSAHVVSRLQSKFAARKAEHRDTRSVRRSLKRLGRKRSRRTNDFARCAAKKLVQWAPSGAVLVFEDLKMRQPMKGLTRGVALRRRLTLWQHGAIREAITSKAEMAGLAITYIDPAYTSQNCSRCGLRGKRSRHAFACSHCGHTAHSDVNAAINIRNKFVQSRLDGVPSIIP